MLWFHVARSSMNGGQSENMLNFIYLHQTCVAHVILYIATIALKAVKKAFAVIKVN